MVLRRTHPFPAMASSGAIPFSLSEATQARRALNVAAADAGGRMGTANLSIKTQESSKRSVP
jgi:hypothetical protein